MRAEINYIIDAIANEKGLPRQIVIGMIENALAAATAKKFYDKKEVSVRVEIDPETGNYEAFRSWTVLEDQDPELENQPEKFISITEAKSLHPELPELEVGVDVEEPIEWVESGRIEAQYAKHILAQEIQKEERNKVIRNYVGRIGELVTGVVKKVIRDGIILDLGDQASGIIMKDQLIPRENFRLGDRVRAYLYDINKEAKGPQLLLSRTHPDMLIRLFEIEVPEIGEQVIEIKSAARDPGSRAKIAVKTNDGRIDPIGSCVGMRGARVQAASNELNGERVDIILWDPNPAQFVINAMAPAEVHSITVDEDHESMDVIVDENQLSQAIGRSGQNVKLASELTGWKLNILAESEAIKKDEEENQKTMQLFVDSLGIDEDLAAFLIQEGFSTIKDIAYVPRQEMLAIAGMSEEIVEELKSRAKDALLTKELSKEKFEGIPEELVVLEGMTPELAQALIDAEIKTREDLAELSVLELCDIHNIDEKLAAKIIMEARAPWFESE